MTVTSSRKCLELSRNSGPLGSLVRMLLELYPWSSRAVTLEWRAEQLTDCRTQTIMRRYCHDKSTRLSSTSSEILNASDMKSRYLLFRLVPSTPRTGGTDAPLWHTPNVPNGGRVNPLDMSPTGKLPDGRKRQVGLEHQVRMVERGTWPTPTAADSYTGRLKSTQQKPGSMHSVNLSDAVRMWPTVTASDWRHRGPNSRQQGLPEAVRMFPTPTRFDAECGDLKGKEYNGQSRHAMKLIQAAKLYTTPCASDAQGTSGGNNSRSLRTDVGGQLNPTWVEWLMGFPLGWTDLGASETP